MKVKYIMLDDCMPVIFGEYLVHADVAQQLRSSGQVTSAGFVGIGGAGQLYAYGESISLNMKPNLNDSKTLNKVFDGLKAS